MCVLTWLLGRQSQLWVQVWTVVRIYPAFVLLSSTANPVQTDTCKRRQRDEVSIHEAWHLLKHKARRHKRWVERNTTDGLLGKIERKRWDEEKEGERWWRQGQVIYTEHVGHIWGLGVKWLLLLNMHSRMCGYSNVFPRHGHESLASRCKLIHAALLLPPRSTLSQQEDVIPGYTYTACKTIGLPTPYLSYVNNIDNPCMVLTIAHDPGQPAQSICSLYSHPVAEHRWKRARFLCLSVSMSVFLSITRLIHNTPFL